MKRVLAIPTILAICAAFAAAQDAASAPAPAPELKKLDYFAGTWKTQGEIKPGPMGPGGKFSSVDHYEWMTGKFFLVSHSRQTTSMGNAVGTAYFGYNTDDKNYTYDAFNTMGEAEHAKGTVEGDTWTWTATNKMGGKVMKGRYTVTVSSPTSYNIKFEIAPEGGDYSTVVEGKATKMTAAKTTKGAEGAAGKK